tara:strand:- start:24084 stop:24947 length:864 start_codon:yes stop_codon:yes gene_type:complete
MIRDVTGLNEARDGSNPDRHALVGLQKLAAANSNVATRHLLQAMMYLTIRACENISLRVNDSLMFPLTRQTLENSISRFNVGTLEELVDFSIHEFGIFLELEPDEEEKQMLEQNIQIALKTQSITLSDAIDLRNINNLKLANQMLKQRQAKREKQKQEQQQQMIQAQAQANSKQAQEAIQAEMQKQQALAETTVQVEQAKSQLELSRIQQQGEIDKQLLQMRYQYDMQLKQMEVQAKQQKENMIEDRKDQRTKLEGSQQSQMISQRQTNGGAIDFMNPFNGLEQQSL